ncbi:MAG: DUF1961 family protein [Bacteroidetes bacterium]|nr:DUF1961 family protein [Bacteroidota bacterium]
MKAHLSLLMIAFLQLACAELAAQSFLKGELLYANALAGKADTVDWRMEGDGQVELMNGWMKLYSPNEKGHHVFWCPQEFPESFIAEWEVQNLHPQAGLCIVFFAAKGLKGEDIFDASLPVRDGTFKGYTNGAIHNYHISYYANGENEPERETAHLRKNKGFHKVQSLHPGIPTQSQAIHKIQLVKYGGSIQLSIDARRVIDWIDDGQKWGKILQGGKIGFRQMKWTQFQYRNFNVWECKSAEAGKQ